MTIEEFVKRGQAAQEAVDRFTLGTAWVAPGEGSTWRELFTVFGEDSLALLPEIRRKAPGGYCNPCGKAGMRLRTNLLLTGAPLQPEDRRRWESGKVE